jgi:hypothetical protein
MIRFLYILALFFTITSCSPVKRFNRLIERNPELITSDTVTLVDTIRVIVPEVKVDTVVSVQSLLDTVYLEQEQLKVKVWMKGDQVFIQGKCDTVYVDKIIERKIPVKYYKKEITFSDVMQYIFKSVWILFAMLLFVYLIYRFLLKR